MNRKSIFILGLVLLLVLAGITSCNGGINAPEEEMKVLKEVINSNSFDKSPIQTSKDKGSNDNFNNNYTIKAEKTIKPLSGNIEEITIKKSSNYSLKSEVKLNQEKVTVDADLKINLHIEYKLKGLDKVKQLNINGKFTINGDIEYAKVLNFSKEDFKNSFTVKSNINFNNKRINVNKEFVEPFKIIRLPG